MRQLSWLVGIVVFLSVFTLQLYASTEESLEYQYSDELSSAPYQLVSVTPIDCNEDDSCNGAIFVLEEMDS